MHSFLDRYPLRSVPGKIALVHRQRDRSQVNLAHEAGHARDLDSIGMAEELAARNEPTKLVAAQSWNVVDTAAFGLGDPVPTSEGCARGANGKAVFLLEVDRGRFDAGAVDGHLQLGAQD